MHRIYALYGFELKKILMRKIVWITLGVMIALNIWIPFADLSSTGYWVDSKDYTGYELMTVDRDAAEKLSGKPIDDTLLSEMQESLKYKKGRPKKRPTLNKCNYAAKSGMPSLCQ